MKTLMYAAPRWSVDVSVSHMPCTVGALGPDHRGSVCVVIPHVRGFHVHAMFVCVVLYVGGAYTGAQGLLCTLTSWTPRL